MLIPFTCPHCGVQTNVGEQYAGQSGPCSGCGKTITVPSFEGGSLAAAHAARPSAGPVIALIVVVVLLLLLVCGGLLAVAFFRVTGMAPMPVPAQVQCTNQLKMIGLAMHNYHDSYKCFPAAVISDEDEQPMHSWRVAILPFSDQPALFEMYNFDEAWDGPSNSILLDVLPGGFYRCPDDFVSGEYETSYVRVVGEGTLGGQPNEEVRIADILDGTSNTILVIEVAGTGISWTEPRDITLEEAVTFITDPDSSPFEQTHFDGVNVLMADGRAQFLPNSIDPQVLRALLTRDDGQVVPANF